MNLLQSFKNYLLGEKPAPSVITIKNYLSDVNKFMFWFQRIFGKNFSPLDVNASVVERFKQETLEIFSASSVERYISSLRKFFHFLKEQQVIEINPFDEAIINKERKQILDDPWNLKAFKNYLYLYNSSHLTIKNYIIDVRQFFEWLNKLPPEIEGIIVSKDNPLASINSRVLEIYRDSLFANHVYSASSINRKLSSLRKYLQWTGETQGFGIHKGIDIRNIKEQTPINVPSVTPLVIGDKPVKILEKTLATRVKTTRFSPFPPIRLAQKIMRGSDFLMDKFLITPSLEVIDLLTYKLWKLNGTSIFKQNQFGFYNTEVLNRSNVRNIRKENYAPLEISLDSLPFWKRTWITLRYKRPLWYKRYHNYALATYFHASILIIFSSAVGFAFYSAFIQTPKQESPLFAAANQPLRTLAFSVKLTDDDHNPITTPEQLRFVMYNDPLASGSGNRLWEETRTVYPSKDGVFSVILGSGTIPGQPAPLCNNGNPTLTPATGSCAIPESVFTTHEGVYLGVSIDNKAELQPRQQLANTSYAANAQAVAGLLPITDASVTGNTNALLALNSSGSVYIPGSATTTIESPQGKLALSGNVLSLYTAAGSNANIELYPDGAGFIDAQKPIQNSSQNNNIRAPDGSSSAAGAVEIDDLFAVLATSSGQSAFTINQNGNGPIISASASGTAKFTVDSSGDVTALGDITGHSFIGQNFGISGNVTSSLVPAGPFTFNLGSEFSPWKNVYAGNYYAPVTGGVAGYLQLNNGALSPTNTSNDLLVGGAATESAVWQVFATGPLAGSASMSGNLSFRGTNPTINILNGQSLSFQTSDGSNNQLATRLLINSMGNIGIGTTTPTDKLQITGDVRIGTSGTNGCIKDASGGAIAGTCSSDIRLKKNIQSLPGDILDKVASLQPVTFNWDSQDYPQFGFGQDQSMGLIAQQVESVLPGLVEDNGPYGFKAVKYQQLPFYLLEAIREQQQQLKGLTAITQDLSLNTVGDLAIMQNVSDSQTDYSVVNPLGEIITTVGQFADIVVGNLRAGAVQTQQLIASNITVAGQSLQDYIINTVRQANLALNNTILSPLAEVDQVHTNIISPLGSDNKIVIKVNPNSIEIAKDATSAAVAIIDNNGNASFSGSLTSSSLAVNGDATIAGTLHAGKIEANDIVGLSATVGTLSAQYITNINNVYYATPSSLPNTSITSSNSSPLSNNSYSLLTSFADIGSVSAVTNVIPSLQTTAVTVEQGLISLGPTTLSDTSITGQLSINGQLILADNGINVLGSDLQLQPLRQGGISFVGGEIKIDNDGNLTVNGNASFQSVLSANIISPLAGQDLTVRLGNSQQTTGGNLSVQNASGSAVLTITPSGDVLASGSATFTKFNLNFVPQAYALSDMEIVASGSAGEAAISSYRNEVTIDTPLVTDKSLIYISPVGNPPQQPSLLRQVPGTSFTVGIRQWTSTPTQFNWLIIN